MNSDESKMSTMERYEYYDEVLVPKLKDENSKLQLLTKSYRATLAEVHKDFIQLEKWDLADPTDDKRAAQMSNWIERVWGKVRAALSSESSGGEALNKRIDAEKENTRLRAEVERVTEQRDRHIQATFEADGENAKLRQQLADYEHECETIKEMKAKVAELEAENERLKKRLSNAQLFVDEINLNGDLKNENCSLRQELARLKLITVTFRTLLSETVAYVDSYAIKPQRTRAHELAEEIRKALEEK